MTSPLDFLKALVAKLTAARIEFAVTSGMACVFYGVQQTTKDVDVVLSQQDLGKFLDLLSVMEHEMPPWRVSYRVVFGAPLDVDYMAHGWTSHLSLWPRADSPEQHLDIFCKPPRVSRVERAKEDPAFASRHTVAQMKRTDRDRDWPVVDALGLQLRHQDPKLALLHIQDASSLRDLWRQASPEVQAAAAAHRPLLRLLPSIADPDELHAWLRIERAVWETVNQERYRLYASAWKDFYRRWRADEAFAWPTSEPFHGQHARISEAAARFGLLRDPLGAVGREALFARAVHRAAVRTDSTAEKVARVQPPLAEVLP
jgi:hypothetical protein